jgi:hypothetical protein
LHRGNGGNHWRAGGGYATAPPVRARDSIVVLLAQQVVNTLSHHPIHALGPILGIQFQWEKTCGFFLDGGTTFILDADTSDLGGAQRSSSVPLLWQWSMGLNLRF